MEEERNQICAAVAESDHLGKTAMENKTRPCQSNLYQSVSMPIPMRIYLYLILSMRINKPIGFYPYLLPRLMVCIR